MPVTGCSINLHCGKKILEEVKFEVSDGEYDSYGIENCRKIMHVASKMKHIKESGTDFDPRLAHRYMTTLKQAVSHGIWKQTCPEWFIESTT